MNLPALAWAYEQQGLSVTMNAVLISFSAVHADARGYSWPGSRSYRVHMGHGSEDRA